MGQLKYNKHGEERLEILGRKKTRQEELYVNHASVWVDVKALESCFSQIPILRHVFLAGDRNRASLVAVVVLAEHVDTEEDEIIRQFERFAPKDAKSYVVLLSDLHLNHFTNKYTIRIQVRNSACCSTRTVRVMETCSGIWTFLENSKTCVEATFCQSHRRSLC